MHKTIEFFFQTRTNRNILYLFLYVKAVFDFCNSHLFIIITLLQTLLLNIHSKYRDKFNIIYSELRRY